jgi:predicted DNA-binding protein YlxM (UPF0122 family)
MKPLTKKQKEILDYYIMFLKNNQRYPSLVEAGEEFGIQRGSVYHRLKLIQNKGYIKLSMHGIYIYDLRIKVYYK